MTLTFTFLKNSSLWVLQNLIIKIVYLLFFSTSLSAYPFTNTLKQGEQLFHDHLYSEAALHYQALFATQSRDQAFLEGRVLQCFFIEKMNEEAEKWLFSDSSGETQQALYFKALFLKREGKVNEALLILDQINEESLSKEERNLLYLQKGVLAFDAAALEKVEDDQKRGAPFLLAQLYLMMMTIDKGEYEEATQRWNFLNPSLPSEAPSLLAGMDLIKGLILLKKGNMEEAERFFQKVIDSPPLSTTTVLREIALLYAIQTNLILFNSEESNPEDREKRLKALFEGSKKKSLFPLKAEFYLLKAAKFKDLEAYQKAQRLLFSPSLSLDEKGKTERFLQLLHAHPIPNMKEALFKEILSQNDLSDEVKAKITFSFALDFFLEEDVNHTGSKRLFLESEKFNQEKNPHLQNALLKALAIAEADEQNETEAFAYLKKIEQNGFSNEEEKRKFCHLFGSIALASKNKERQEEALKLLEKAPKEEKNFLLTLSLLLECGAIEEAKEKLTLHLAFRPEDGHKIPFLFILAELEEKSGNEKGKVSYLEKIYSDYPSSQEAAEAFFKLYPLKDYFQGSETKNLHHLKKMTEKFPNSPQTALAYYLIGIDLLKEKREGSQKIIQRKDLVRSIDAFYQAETLACSLAKTDKRKGLKSILFEAKLERAKTHLLIAEEAKNGKRKIYLEFAESLFRELLEESKESPRGEYFRQEATFYLAQTLRQKGEWQAALELFNRSLSEREEKEKELSYFSFRLLYEKGQLFQKREEWREALKCYEEIQRASLTQIDKEKKLTLWIEASHCFKELKEYESSMQLLSKVINEPTISSKRIEAMFLRAELYQLQGRRELALKQLQAIVLKGGERSKEAEEKLKLLLQENESK